MTHIIVLMTDLSRYLLHDFRKSFAHFILICCVLFCTAETVDRMHSYLDRMADFMVHCDIPFDSILARELEKSGHLPYFVDTAMSKGVNIVECVFVIVFYVVDYILLMLF